MAKPEHKHWWPSHIPKNKLLAISERRGMWGPSARDGTPNHTIWRGTMRKPKIIRMHWFNKDKMKIDRHLDELLERLKVQAIKDKQTVHLFCENIVMRPSKHAIVRKALEMYLLQYFPDSIPTPPWYDDPDASDPWRSI